MNYISRVWLFVTLFWSFDLSAADLIASEDWKVFHFIDHSGAVHEFKPDAYTPIQELNNSIIEETDRVLFGSRSSQNQRINVSGTVPFSQDMVVSQVRAIRLQRSQTIAFIIQTTNGDNFLHLDITSGSSSHYVRPDASAILTASTAETEGFTQRDFNPVAMRFYNDPVSFNHLTQLFKRSNCKISGQDLVCTTLTYTIPIRVGVEWFPSEHRLALPIEGSSDFTYSTLEWAAQIQFTTQPVPQL